LVYRDGVSIVSYDSSYNQILLLNLDGEINVEVSGNLGYYPLKSVYELSQNEKQGDILFRKTIMRNIHIPIYNVIDCRTNSIGKFNIKNLLFSCRRKADTLDLVYMVYSKWRAGKNLIEKDLDYYGVLDDREVGGLYLKDDKLFPKLELDFSKGMDISEIVNVTFVSEESTNPPAYFSDIIKILGGRVVRKTNEGIGQSTKGCEAIGNDEEFLRNVQKIFNCKTSKGDDATKIYFSADYLGSY
jgi:hypothetical protein